MWPPVQNIIATFPYIAVGIIDLNGKSDLARILHFCFCVVDPPYTLLGTLFVAVAADVNVVVFFGYKIIINLSADTTSSASTLSRHCRCREWT